MINLKPQIYTALKTTSADDVVYFYPEKWIKGQKLISYYELDNSEASNADDEEYSSNIAIQIDIWCDAPSQCSQLAIEVNSVMKGLGFSRTLCLDLYQQESIKHHKTMRYEKEEILEY